HTYEGRRNTELRGNWDLTAGIARVRDAGAVAAAEAKALPAPYALRPRLNPDDVRIALGAGWYDLEQLPRTRERWRWATADAELTVETRGPLARHATIELDVRSVQPRELEVWRGAARLGSVLVGVNRTVARFPQLLLEPGTTTLRLRSQTPAVAPGGADSRPLLVCVYRFDLVLHPAELPLPPSGAARQNRLP
ncbi:MAG TPA: hypothetical protein VHF69_08005, partial [Candidatus Synoicihabitans sp.]|nr:hypothetical protein [Candidatus Synoicihabitans sp.]